MILVGIWRQKSARTLYDLYDFIAWCTSKKDVDSAIELGNIEMRVLAICHNMISLVCKFHTPITFGLGVNLHHDHGSRELIDEMSSLGHSIPYDEVRRFLNVIAFDQLSTKSDFHILGNISVYYPENVRTTVDAARDNFDQNDQTIDGRNTTHLMVVVLCQRSPKPEETPCIPKKKC